MFTKNLKQPAMPWRKTETKITMLSANSLKKHSAVDLFERSLRIKNVETWSIPKSFQDANDQSIEFYLGFCKRL